MPIVVQDYLQLFRRRRRRRRAVQRRREIEEEAEEDDYDNEAEDYSRILSCFSGIGAPALENKHRKDRNCFSERFDSRQMNLLKYTRNSTSRQYLHERSGRIYPRGLHTAPFKPPSISTMARRRDGPCGCSFYCCKAVQSGSRGKKSSRTDRQNLRDLFATFRSRTRSAMRDPEN